MESTLDPRPLEETPSREIEGARAAAPGASILVVEDDPDIRELLREILEDRGYAVSEAATAREAVSAVERSPFALAIIDLVTPEQEGIETILILKQKRPDLRVLAISGAAGDVYLKAAGYLGASATLRKPFSCASLHAAVATALEPPRIE